MTNGGSRRKFVFSTVPLLFARRLLRGQETPTFTTSVKVVNLLASVRTKKGEIIRDLTKDDFSVAENGRPQTIRYFAQETDLPLTLGLMVDTSMSQRKVVDTPTRRELQSQTGGGTLLYDAVVMASQDFMTKPSGRKALIVISDGVDTGSEAPITAAIDAAQRADTLVYSILFSDPGAYGIPLPRLFGRVLEPDGEGVLMRMSKETGGHFYAVSKKRTLNQVFDSIQSELRSQYSLGYVSDEPVRVSEFRNIRLTTRRNGLVVQCRDKYWARR